MNGPGYALLFTVALVFLTSFSCRHGQPRLALDPGTGPFVGQYKGRVQESGRGSRPFRLLLYASLPDRLHAEVLSPVGSTQLILDGGGGKLAITFVPDGISFVGEARSEAFERILGVTVSLEQLVRGLLTGEGGTGDIRWARSGRRSPGLPDTLEIRSPSSSVRLELRRLRSVVQPAELGTGRPPGGTEVRPIQELHRHAPRVEELFSGGGR